MTARQDSTLMHHSQSISDTNPRASRRDLLSSAACGFGALALAGLTGSAEARPKRINPLAPKEPHFAPKAKRVIFLFMQGGPSHMDTFDYKPALFNSDGKSIDFTGVRFNTFGQKSQRQLMKPLWDFKQYGQCGQHVSSLFPHIAKHVDDLCFLKGMQTEGVAHGPSTLFLHTGATAMIRPSMGSWVTYGLGTENQNLPGFITINPSATKGGPRNYGNAFLPPVYQGTRIGRALQPAMKATIDNIENQTLSGREQRRRFDLIQKMNQQQAARGDNHEALEAVIDSYELAARMQITAPGILNLSEESAKTQAMYGIGQKETDDFGRMCLKARRLAEQGVRFIQVNYADESNTPMWDQHNNMPEHADHAKATDLPVAGLLEDLKQRGLLEDTLVWWGGEFGRTPFTQNNMGRDHNPRGFTSFLAGGGVKRGFSFGETDEIGGEAVADKVHMHDLHATILHLMGLDHEELTFHHAGRDFRLTDLAGNVATEIIA